MTETHRSTSWWSSTIGILTAIAGVLTAVTGLIVAIHQIWPTDGSHHDSGCDALSGMALDLTTKDGAHGVIGPAGIVLNRNSSGKYRFHTTANFTGQPVDGVEGTCWDDSISFTRTRPGVFVQYYTGHIGPTVEGILGDNAQTQTTTWRGALMQP